MMIPMTDAKRNRNMKKTLPSDLELVIALVLLTDILIFIPVLNESPFRTALGIPMLLFLPGYALVAALFPRKDDLDALERFALSIGLSIAVVPFIGLALNYTPWGIRLIPLLASISIFVITMSMVAAYRRRSLDDDAFCISFDQFNNAIRKAIAAKPRTGVERALSVLLLLSILISVSTLVYVMVTPKQGEQFTEFYILGPSGKATGYNTSLKLGESVDVTVGVVNHEYAPVTYSLELKLDNDKIDMPENFTRISLDHGDSWYGNLSYYPTELGEDMKLEYLLYKEGDTTPYRDLHLWIDVR